MAGVAIIAAALIVGLTGVTVLQINCANANLFHILFWHGGAEESGEVAYLITAVLLVASELPRPRLPLGIAKLASLLPPSLPAGPTSDRAGIDLPLCYLEPPALRLSGPHLVAATILAFKLLVPVPGLGRIGIVRSMLRHIGPDCIVRDYRHQIFPKLFRAKASIPNGSRTRPRSAFFLRFFVNRIGHVCPSV